jgi:hypothetical protein
MSTTYSVDLFFEPSEESLERPFTDIEKARSEAVYLSCRKPKNVIAVWDSNCHVQMIAIDGLVFKAD